MGKGFGELFSDTIKEYQKKFFSIFRVFLFLYLIPLALVSILLIILFVGTFSSLGLSFLEKGSFDLSRDFLSGLSPSYLALFLLGVFVIIIFLGIFYILANVSYIHIGFNARESFNFKKTFAFARQNFWRYLRFILLMIICLIPLYLLLIVPGIIFTVFWVFASYILLSGKDSAWESMKKSKSLVKRKWWRVFGYGLLLLIIVIALNSILGYIPFAGNIVSALVLTPFTILFFKNFWIDLKTKSA